MIVIVLQFILCQDEVPQALLDSHMKNAKEAITNGAESIDSAGLDKSG